MRWTVEQNITLARNASLGVDEVVRVLRAEFGIDRNRAAVKKQASRLGISLARVCSCPMCGHVGPAEDFNDNGICDACFALELVERQRERNHSYRREAARREHDRLTKQRRTEYARLRQEGSRFVRRNNLEDFRDAAKTSPKTSPRRSEAQKKENSPEQQSLF